MQKKNRGVWNLRPRVDGVYKGIRSLAYGFDYALCELIDNSISANAKNMMDVYMD